MMPDKVVAPEVTPAPAAPPVPRRGPGHRGQDVRDAVAEMTLRAQEISLEAGSKMAAAMKEVIHAAAGITNFAVDSARDLAQFMVRRGQMTQDEADKLIREAEDAASKHKRPVKSATAAKHAPAKTAAHAAPKHAASHHAPSHHATVPKHAASHHAPSHHAAAKPAAKKHAAPAKKHAAKKSPAARKPAAKKHAAKKPAAKKK